ncbi:MAG: peptidylprolyl isomerase [Deltaproteobacteria bacterium]|nr:peptidylprolyl isomerase [Deltaproteobacteria bacterium]MCL4873377.1 peptidylprolyl isomerase [bacterium]
MKGRIALFFLLFFTLAVPFLAIAEEGAGDSKREKRAIIETAYGNLEIRLFPDIAPKHVENFVRLAKEGFYDGTIFHEAVPGFKIQGGDPYTKANSGKYTGCCPRKSRYGLTILPWTVPAEFSRIPHKRGIVSMARFEDDPDSASSQFFIVLKDSGSLDGKYTVFGEVASGMEVADRIAALPKDEDYPNLPEERVEMKVRILE